MNDSLPTMETVNRLVRFRAAREGVLSLYLTFPPSGGERRDVRGAVASAFQTLAESGMTDVQREGFERERERVESYFRKKSPLRGRSVILFSCEPRGLWEVFQLQAPSITVARFGPKPAVSQLAAILDEQERYGILIVDKDRARLMSVYLGEVENETDIRNGYPGRTSAGGWSQARFERHREAHLHTHITKVVDTVAKEQRRRHFDRILVAGPPRARTALLGALPRSLRARIAGTFACELFASQEEVLGRAAKLVEAAEREGEERLIDHIMEAGRNKKLAVFGWDEVLPGLFAGRAHKLVMVDGIRKRGRVCPQGHLAARRGLKDCPVCQDQIAPARDLTETAVGAALDAQTIVEMVRGNAAPRLRAEGGVSALLRY